MTKKLVCDWDHRDEPEVLVREGKRWYLSCEKHAADFSPSYVVPIAKSALMAEAFKSASTSLELLRAGKILRVTNTAEPYRGWEFYAAIVKVSDGDEKVCDIGYSADAKRFISPLYLTPERYYDSLVKLFLNGWRFEALEGSVANEEELRRFVRNLHRR
jgi:hypothetical protein